MVIHSLYYSVAGILWKNLNLPSITETVVSKVNSVHFHELNHLQFHEFLLEIGSEYLDLHYHIGVVQYFSHSEVLL